MFRPTELRIEPRVELLAGPWCNIKTVQLRLREYSESPDAPTLVGYRVSSRRVGVTLAATTRIDNSTQRGVWLPQHTPRATLWCRGLDDLALPRHHGWASTSCQSTHMPLDNSVAGEHFKPPLAPTNERAHARYPVKIPAVTSRRSRRSPWVSDISSTIAPSKTGYRDLSLLVGARAVARQRSARLKSTSTSLLLHRLPPAATTAHMNLSHQGARLKTWEDLSDPWLTGLIYS